VGFHSKLATTP